MRLVRSLIFLQDWTDYLNIGWSAGSSISSFNIINQDDSREAFIPDNIPNTPRGPAPNFFLEATENVRAEKCTLKEHHEHLLSGSFDLSFQGSAGIDVSSSQIDHGFPVEDFFLPGDDFDIGGGLGEDFAKELEDVWGQEEMHLPKSLTLFLLI